MWLRDYQAFFLENTEDCLCLSPHAFQGNYTHTTCDCEHCIKSAGSNGRPLTKTRPNRSQEVAQRWINGELWPPVQPIKRQITDLNKKWIFIGLRWRSKSMTSLLWTPRLDGQMWLNECGKVNNRCIARQITSSVCARQLSASVCETEQHKKLKQNHAFNSFFCYILLWTQHF